MMDFSMSVTELNEYVRRSLAGDPMLRRVCLSGEIGTLKMHSSGHWYFTLKDEESAINCAMFRQHNLSVRFRPENGQKVKLTGSVGLYTKTGSYQFYAESMEPDGVGELYLRFEALKRRLEARGLFDASLKKPLPLLPKGIGIVTSATGAVIHDIARVCWRRFPGMPLYLCPVKVQGEGAAEEIARGIALLDRLPEAEVLIVGRGGGSMEDLWPFNEEAVALAIARCETPVISAVGHETDFTIADFTADMRAATPSMAAELAVPSRRELLVQVDGLQYELTRTMKHELEQQKLRLSALDRRLAAQSPDQQSKRMLEKVNRLEASLHKSLRHALERDTLALDALKNRLSAQAPEKQCARLAEKLLGLDNTLRKALERGLEKKGFRLNQAALRIRAAGPEAALEKGYTLISTEEHMIRSVSELHAGQRVRLRLRDGSVHATIE